MAQKILVVDDTPQNVKLLGDLLTATGYEVTTAANGEQALERLARLKSFFSPQLAEAIAAGKGEDVLKTHRREITVEFFDLRGFTAFTDNAEPEEVMELLRAYHASLGKLVLEHQGTLERFAG